MEVELPPGAISLLSQPLSENDYVEAARQLADGLVQAVFVRTEVETQIVASQVGPRLVEQDTPVKLQRTSVVLKTSEGEVLESWVLHNEGFDFHPDSLIPSIFVPEEGFSTERAIADAWAFEGTPPVVPVPKFDLMCPNPSCHGVNVQYSRLDFGMRDDSPNPFRANASFKCRTCSMFWTFGLIISPDIYNHGIERAQIWDRRDIARYLGKI